MNGGMDGCERDNVPTLIDTSDLKVLSQRKDYFSMRSYSHLIVQVCSSYVSLTFQFLFLEFNLGFAFKT